MYKCLQFLILELHGYNTIYLEQIDNFIRPLDVAIPL